MILDPELAKKVLKALYLWIISNTAMEIKLNLDQHHHETDATAEGKLRNYNM